MPCLRCGHCCRAVSLDFGKDELVALARKESQVLQRNPHTPHRLQIERLLSDVQFISDHFREIDRQSAIALNSGLESVEGRRFFVCDALGADGLCTTHSRRPYVCEGYPWYYGAPNPELLIHRPCGYESDIKIDRRLN